MTKPAEKPNETDPEDPPKAEGQKPAGAGGAPDPPAAPAPAAPAATPAVDVQAEIQAGVKAELDRQKAEADRQAAEQRGEIQPLYDALKAEHATLTGERDDLKKQVGKLTKFINGQIDAEVAGWDDEVLKLTDPGADDLVGRMAWLEKLRPKLAERAAKKPETKKPEAPPPGAPPTPPPASNGAGAATGGGSHSVYRGW